MDPKDDGLIEVLIEVLSKYYLEVLSFLLRYFLIILLVN